MVVHIGTAGYVYAHWRKGNFYPSGVSQKDELSHYLQHFPTVEINATYHAFPRSSVLEKWRNTASPFTRFALKAPAKITHEKRLVDVRDDIVAFCKVAHDSLRENLGPILFQCPPSLGYSEQLLENFLQHINAAREACENPLRIAVEFRSPLWFVPYVFSALAKNDIALVNNVVVSDKDFSALDNMRFPHARAFADIPRASWSYNRFHGSKSADVSTDFPDSVLRVFAKHAANTYNEKKEITTEYSFFLNDWDAIAPRNAKRYAQIVAEEAAVSVKELFGGFAPSWTKRKRDIHSFFTPSLKADISPKRATAAATDAAEKNVSDNVNQSPFLHSPLTKSSSPGAAAGATTKATKRNAATASFSTPIKSSAIQKKKRKNNTPPKLSRDITSYFSASPSRKAPP